MGYLRAEGGEGRGREAYTRPAEIFHVQNELVRERLSWRRSCSSVYATHHTKQNQPVNRAAPWIRKDHISASKYAHIICIFDQLLSILIRVKKSDDGTRANPGSRAPFNLPGLGKTTKRILILALFAHQHADVWREKSVGYHRNQQGLYVVPQVTVNIVELIGVFVKRRQEQTFTLHWIVFVGVVRLIVDGVFFVLGGSPCGKSVSAVAQLPGIDR